MHLTFTMNPFTIILIALAQSIHLVSSQAHMDQIPLSDKNIIRDDYNGSISVSSDTTSLHHSNESTHLTADTQNTAAIAFASAFLTKSNAPPDTHLAKFSWAGTGCATPESLYAKFDNDDDSNKSSAAFSYFTPQFSLVRGSKDAIPADSRKACTVTFELTYPAGWQYSLGGAESKGYVGYSAGGAGAVVEGAYWFAGVGGTERWSSRLQPPLHEEWMLGYKPNDGQGLWSRCGGQDMLNVQMSVYLPPSEEDPGVVLLEWTNLYMRWQKCE